MTNILIVEDEKKLARVLQLELEYEGYQAACLYNGKDAVESIVNDSWDLVLLDIQLPELSGFEVLRRVRKEGANVPVLLLTARDEVHDKVSGLDLGANDYITKPFQIEELLARIRAHLRQQPKQKQEMMKIGDLVVNLQTREVQRGNHFIELTPREFDLLVFLLKNENQVLTRDQIIEQVWGYDYLGETNVVDVYIRYLRRKIDKPYDQAYIQTIRGVGYSIREG
ncbi:response regulator transcription factor [Salinibacillus xinjiangensis]|uniref:Response regulator n=1 Tax=Salinibacillus xinjiangensis TaxID=1229268 RepID=A0A6G1X8P1_9BACI|nr:response regulator transcription factor [Salinibacillus xinjiangensis]MRG87334.1 response regulator [Salinibacillus xinjiangensis]